MRKLGVGPGQGCVCVLCTLTVTGHSSDTGGMCKSFVLGLKDTKYSFPFHQLSFASNLATQIAKAWRRESG